MNEHKRVNYRKTKEKAKSPSHSTDEWIQVHQWDMVFYFYFHVGVVDVNKMRATGYSHLFKRVAKVVVVDSSPLKGDIIFYPWNIQSSEYILFYDPRWKISLSPMHTESLSSKILGTSPNSWLYWTFSSSSVHSLVDDVHLSVKWCVHGKSQLVFLLLVNSFLKHSVKNIGSKIITKNQNYLNVISPYQSICCVCSSHPWWLSQRLSNMFAHCLGQYELALANHMDTSHRLTGLHLQGRTGTSWSFVCCWQ